VPRAHFAGLDDLTAETAPLVGKLALAAQKLARELGVSATGYRFVSNCGPDAGQTVHHLHFHLLGGGPMGGRMA
jgi:histidine triad (HIT) family protein